MMKKLRIALFIGVLLACLSLASGASAQTLAAAKTSEIPEKIQRYLDDHYPGHEVKYMESEPNETEVVIEYQKKCIETEFDKALNFVEAEGCDDENEEAEEENEVEIGYDQLPAPARKYLEERYKGFEFEEAEIEDGKEYEVEFEYQNKCWEAEFDKQGKFLEIEPCD